MTTGRINQVSTKSLKTIPRRERLEAFCKSNRVNYQKGGTSRITAAKCTIVDSQSDATPRARDCFDAATKTPRIDQELQLLHHNSSTRRKIQFVRRTNTNPQISLWNLLIHSSSLNCCQQPCAKRGTPIY